MARLETRLDRIAFSFPEEESTRAKMISFLEALHYDPTEYPALALEPTCPEAQLPDP